MIFAGDVAIAPNDSFSFEMFPTEILSNVWCLNLEGAMADSVNQPRWGVYNSLSWTESFKNFNLGPIFVGNNHIHDVQKGIDITYSSLSEHNLKMFGAGITSDAAVSPLRIRSGANEYRLIGFGWHVIGCRPAEKGSPGVNRLEGRLVRQQASEAVSNAKGSRVVVVLHGNYEFEPYPQPGQRKLALQLIDLGVYAVIFHHPHIVGPVERYKGKTIAYTLGNWAFSYGRFFGGKLRFPESSFPQIALELGPESDIVHHALFSPPSTVAYQFSEDVESADFSLKPEFEGFAHTEYIRWFKQHRVKRKLLPIYKEPDASLGNWLRDRWVGARQILIDAAAKSGLKAMRRNA